MRQFLFLLAKNGLLMKRNITWTVFQIVLPILLNALLLALIIMVINKEDSKDLNMKKSLNIDTHLEIGSVYCHDRVDESVCSDIAQELDADVVKSMEKFGKYSRSDKTTKRNHVYIKYFDKSDQYLEYEIHIIVFSNSDKRWLSHFSSGGKVYSDLVAAQEKIDTYFIGKIGVNAIYSKTSYYELPPKNDKIPFASYILKYYGYFMCFLMLLIVMQTSSDIAAEKPFVKPYLNAMGMSDFVFYSTHGITSFLKFFLTCGVFQLIISFVADGMPKIFMFITFVLYTIGAIIFALLIGVASSSAAAANKASLLLWSGSIAISLLQPPAENRKFSAYMFNINGALSYAYNAIAFWPQAGVDDFDLFKNQEYEISIFACWLFFVIDIIWMSLLAVLINLFLNKGIISTLKTCFKNKNVETTSNSGNKSETFSGWIQESKERETANAGIDISQLVKVWPTGEKAVRGLSMRALVGQVTILLGHNGAGKSTCFACMAGIAKPSNGTILIDGHDIVREQSKCRRLIGMCPQYNPLYDKLTVHEHLWLVNGLKGGKRGQVFKDEEQHLLSALGLEDGKKKKTKNLSGGMKRKLCVAMAMIGQSSVVLLDEPTAGMDPGARRDVEKLINIEKKNRTILLTTHYMDEAERLGDWVYVMSEGMAVASGTCAFLKQKFGTGYILTVVEETGSAEARTKILGICQKNVPGSELGKMHGKQIEIILPVEHRDTGFINLFKELESMQRVVENKKLSRMNGAVNITTFGLSLNTLEQVFLRIGELYERRKMSDKSSEEKQKAKDKQTDEDIAKLFKEQHFKTGFGLILAQFGANLRKRLQFSFVNFFYFVVLIIEVAACLLLLGISAMDASSSKVSLMVSDVPCAYGTVSPGRIDEDKIKNMRRRLDFDVRAEKKLPEDIVKEAEPELPEILFAFDGSEFHVNEQNTYSLANAYNFYSNAHLSDWDVEGKRNAIVAYAVPTSVGGSMISGFVRPITVIFIVALIFSYLIIFPIVEHTSGFRHQLLLTGVSPALLWFTITLIDTLIFCLFAGATIGISIGFEVFDVPDLVFVIVLFLFFAASLFFVYSFSYVFKQYGNAMFFLMSYMAIFAVAIFIAIFVIEMLGTNIDILVTACAFVFPSFSFLKSLKKGLAGLLGGGESEGTMDYLESIDNLLIATSASFFATAIVFFLIQLRPIRFLMSRINFSAKTPLPNEFGDDAVRKEAERVETGDQSHRILHVHKLTKCFRKARAVNGISLAVDDGECFGLLGVNGAGKTTTFDVLTGKTFASSGTVTVEGFSAAKRNKIGFCPQFDALLQDLTGRQVMEIIAQTHGYVDYHERVETILRILGMDEMANKKCKNYSGGQRRRISIGVALLSPGRLLIFDEPTAGVDPKSRRELWEVLLKVQEHSAMMLTSHSMDECEALCSRIAILKKGNMLTIGTSQDIKSRYGNTYTLTLMFKTDAERLRAKEVVAKKYPNLVPSTTGNDSMTWEIPKVATDKWSTKFAEARDLCKEAGLSEYCLAQSSLETTFIRLVGEPVEEDPAKKGKK